MKPNKNIPCIWKIADAKNILGEGPLWDDNTQVLYWVDILSDRLFTYDFRSKSFDFISTPKYPSAVAICENNKLLLAVQGAIVYFDTLSFKYEQFVNIKHKELGLRFNDGKVDPLGEFWVGSKNHHDKIEAGNLISVNGDGRIQSKVDKLTISNGMCWDIDKGKFYLIDSFQRLIWSYDYSLSNGAISNRSVCIRFLEDEGYPDGMTIDKDGFLWIAMWEGSGIFKCDPINGIKVQFISLPISKPTSCVFGGENLDTLFVTTSQLGLSGKELEKQPDAGSVFAISNLDTHGFQSDRFITIDA